MLQTLSQVYAYPTSFQNKFFSKTQPRMRKFDFKYSIYFYRRNGHLLGCATNTVLPCIDCNTTIEETK